MIRLIFVLRRPANGRRRASFYHVRTAVFITPETLLSQQTLSTSGEEPREPSVFRLTGHAVSAINRLKEAGFLIIGLGNEEVFHGFATRSSCDLFLSASSLDDIILPCGKNRFTAAMIQAAAKWLLDLDRSFFIGRDAQDISEAQVTGCTPMQIGRNGKGSKRASADLRQAVEKILKSVSEDESVAGHF